jgi:hypothetical protein
MSKRTFRLLAILLAFAFVTGCAHYRKDCPEPKRLPDEWLECNGHRFDSGKYALQRAGELAQFSPLEISGS